VKRPAVKWLTRVFNANKNRGAKASQSLEAMQKLVNDYSAILAMLKSSGGFMSVEQLPGSKLEIKHALIAVARVAKSTGDTSSMELLHKGYMFLAYFVSHEEAAIMNRFNSLMQAGSNKDVRDERIAEIIREMAKDNRHRNISQRTSDEFSLLFQEFDAEVVTPAAER
jgi:hypothetical protein